ncbi:hypothetical protein CAMGR0001_1220 [Campylobacter gracilis RM3268]|uniref:Tat pathway signal sequence domain protein n=1 Tax=Campylobacter gracilis RM3268 TaxID=553220 RepID=C8PJ21_9BACT|nr:hypothetical protein CAMGR0001_1220 [Campylobacter gracilis RM3268]
MFLRNYTKILTKRRIGAKFCSLVAFTGAMLAAAARAMYVAHFTAKFLKFKKRIG